MWQVTTAKTSKGKGKKREKSEASASAEGGAEAKKKKLKDPNAPKGKKTAFIFFQGEARQTAPFSTMSFTDAGKALGAAWKAMTEEETSWPPSTPSCADMVRPRTLACSNRGQAKLRVHEALVLRRKSTGQT